jgi:hypothetical protein
MEEEKQVQEVETPVEGQTQETAVKDDTNPMDVLRETLVQSAHELGLSEDEIKLMTTKDLQSYVDKAVTQAIKTREERLKKQQEEEKLMQEKKYEELLKMKDEELKKLQLERETLDILTEKGKGKEWMNLLTAPDIDGRKKQLETVEALIDAEVKKRVEELEKGSFKAESKPVEPAKFKNAEEALDAIFTQATQK